MSFLNRPSATASFTVDSPVTLFADDFEGAGQGWDEWTEGTVSVSTDEAHSGTHSMRLAGTSAQWLTVEHDLTALDLNGLPVALTFWAKGVPGLFLINMHTWDVAYGEGGNSPLEFEMSGDWQQVTVTGVAWPDARNRIIVEAYSGGVGTYGSTKAANIGGTYGSIKSLNSGSTYAAVQNQFDDLNNVEIFLDDFELTTLSPRLRLTDGDLTADSGWYPYVQGSVKVPLIDEAILEQLQTGARVRVDATDGATSTDFDLTLRKRAVSHDDKTFTLELASDEALLYTYAKVAHDSMPRTFESDLRALVEYVLDEAIPGATLEPGSANADLTAQWDATNLLKNPGAQVSATHWTAGSGCSIAYNAGDGSDGSNGFVRATMSGTTGTVYPCSTGAFDISATPGKTYTASVATRASVAGSTGSLTLQFLDANNQAVSSLSSALTAIPTDWGTRLTVTAVAPANAARVAPYAVIADTASGRTWDLDAAVLAEGAEAIAPFDGDTPATDSYSYEWDNAPYDSTSKRTASPERMPSLFTWRAGASAWEFLSPLVASAGLRLFCDEQRRWHLVDPVAYTVPGRFSARPANTVEGTDTLDLENEDAGATGVVAYFKWADISGVSHEAMDSAGVAGKVKVLNFDREFPGAGIAAAHLAKIGGQGRTQDVTVATDYTVRPGQEVQIDLPGTAAQLGTLTRVKWELDTGLMTLGSAGLRETPPGAIDLLTGTIDALPGTIDSL